MTNTTTPTTQPATTPTTMEEESPLSVCVLLLDVLPSGSTTVAVVDVDKELAMLVDDSVVDIVRELVDDSTTVVVDIDKVSVVDGFIVAVVVIVSILVDDPTIAVVDIDGATEEPGVIVDNSTVPLIGIKLALGNETDTVGSISTMKNTMFTMK